VILFFFKKGRVGNCYYYVEILCTHQIKYNSTIMVYVAVLD
jgi:hypothetical protein